MKSLLGDFMKGRQPAKKVAAKKTANKSTPIKLTGPSTAFYLPPKPTPPEPLPVSYKLKPCPFCRHPTTHLETGMPSLGYWVKCLHHKCKATGPREPTPVKCAEGWNSAKR